MSAQRKVLSTDADPKYRDYTHLRIELLRQGYSLKNTSKTLDISLMTLKKKLDKPKLFTVGELLTLGSMLNLTVFQVMLVCMGHSVSSLDRIGAEAHKKVERSEVMLEPVKRDDWP